MKTQAQSYLTGEKFGQQFGTATIRNIFSNGQVHCTRWAPTSCNWGEITPISGVTAPVIPLQSHLQWPHNSYYKDRRGFPPPCRGPIILKHLGKRHIDSPSPKLFLAKTEKTRVIKQLLCTWIFRGWGGISTYIWLICMVSIWTNTSIPRILLLDIHGYNYKVSPGGSCVIVWYLHTIV